MTQQPFYQTWGMVGHEWAVEALRKAIRNRRARHAYLIVGAEGLGKETLARGFAMALQCQHADPEQRPCGECSACHRIMTGNFADVFYTVRDTQTLKIDEIRRVASQIAMKPYEGRYRIAIFRDFDTAWGVGQDSLLKTLEEPAETGVLILLARSLDPILPTITSRSQIIRLRPVAQHTIQQMLLDRGADDTQAALFSALSGGRVGWAINALNDPTLLESRDQALDMLEGLLIGTRAKRFSAAEDLAKDKEALRPLLELWLSYWRDLVLVSENAQTPLTNIDRTQRLRRMADALTPEQALAALQATTHLLDVLDTNAGARLALEVMFLDYPTMTAQPA
ncbi:MAG: DNA polymerase III subunit [Anaerolineae bacterium]